MQERFFLKANLRTQNSRDTIRVMDLWICEIFIGLPESNLFIRLVSELVITHRKVFLCLGFSSLLFVDSSLFGIMSKIINGACETLPLSTLFPCHSTFTQQPCHIGLFKFPRKHYLLFYLRAIIIDVSFLECSLSTFPHG